MWRLLLFLIFIILFQRFSKALQEQQEKQQKEEQEIPPQPKPEKPKKPVIIKREIKRPEVEIAEFRPTRIELPPKQTEEAKEQLPTLSTDKLEEGIILSEILGPPKAHQIRRGGGIG